MNLPEPKKFNAQKYEAGLSRFKKRLLYIKLSANESALGPSPKAIKGYNSISKIGSKKRRARKRNKKK